MVAFFKLSNKETVTTREATAVDEAQSEDGAQPVDYDHFLLLGQAQSVPMPLLQVGSADRQGTSWLGSLICFTSICR